MNYEQAMLRRYCCAHLGHVVMGVSTSTDDGATLWSRYCARCGEELDIPFRYAEAQ